MAAGVLAMSACSDAPAEQGPDADTVLVGSMNAWIAENFQGAQDRPFTLVRTTQETVTPCGTAPLDLYPFYCRGNETVYWPGKAPLPDDEVARHLVISHEAAHHIMEVSATSPIDRMLSERRADCYAGAWLTHAQDIGLLDAGELGGQIEDVFILTPRGGAYMDPAARSADVMTGVESGAAACQKMGARA